MSRPAPDSDARATIQKPRASKSGKSLGWRSDIGEFYILKN
jgi:hypothetical protein